MKFKSEAERQFFRTLTSVLSKKTYIAINNRPNFLINHNTGKLLELDFWLPQHKIAFEIQGPSHFEAFEQIERDNIKKEICFEKGIVLFQVGILQNNPNFLYDLFKNLNKSGYNIELNKPDYRWGIRKRWAGKYNENIKNFYGNSDDYYFIINFDKKLYFLVEEIFINYKLTKVKILKEGDIKVLIGSLKSDDKTYVDKFKILNKKNIKISFGIW